MSLHSHARNFSHPGEILQKRFLKKYHISEYRLAKDIAVPARRINEIIHGVRAISTDTALRLAKYFGTTALFWLQLQSRFDLRTQTTQKAKILHRIRRLRI